jgi:glycosyltransferase involved in cell wall biosynthesis
MRILFVTPYPPSRIRVRGYGFLTHLCQDHEVVVLTQCASQSERTDVEVLRNQGYELLVVEESKHVAAVRSGLALLGPHPLQVAYARSRSLSRLLQELCAERSFDVVHVEHLRGIASVEPTRTLPPLVWDAVDCISLLCKSALAAGPNFGVRAMARLEHQRTRRYEADMLGRLRHVVVTSHRDREALIETRRSLSAAEGGSGAGGHPEGESAHIHVVPNGVDLRYFSSTQQERRRHNLVFSGKMSYHANVAAALYLYEQIMPLVWRQQPEATLTIAGSKPPAIIQRLSSDPRVEVTGYVDDLRPYVARARVMVSPMVYSVGIQNKVLEAMALGTPVVVAAQAAQALGARPGLDLLTASSAQEFATMALQVMDDAVLQDGLRACGRRYVEQQHQWSSVCDRLVDIYRQAIADHEAARDPLARQSLIG